jgi:transposase
MEEITTIGLDIAKSVFQVHAISATGTAVVRRPLKRRYVAQFFAGLKPCLIGMEACATAHHWGRELTKLGHEVRLMPPRYVKPYVKRNKNDAADAEAIREAVMRPNMRFVPIKTVDQQSILMLHRTRMLFIRQRTMTINAVRAHLAEFGIVAGVGRNGLQALLDLIRKCEKTEIPAEACLCLSALADQVDLLKQRILDMDRRNGIAPMISVASSKQFQALAPWWQRRWRPASPIQPSFAQVVI